MSRHFGKEEEESIFQEWSQNDSEQAQPIIDEGSLPRKLCQSIPQEPNNIWPPGIVIGLKFGSVEQIKTHFQEIIKASGLSSCLIAVQQLEANSFRVRCKNCHAFMNFKRMRGGFELRGFNNKHTHVVDSKKYKHLEELEQDVFKFMRETSETQIRRSVMQIFSLSEGEYDRIRKNFYTQEVNDYTYLQNFMKDNKYNAIVEWDDIKGVYPRTIVAVTENMKNNYRRYRDLLRFDVLDIVLKNRIDTSKRYSQAVFSVVDSSNKIVVAGIAVYNEESEENYVELFENLIKLQDRLVPDVILSDCSTPILKAVKTLTENNVFSGLHIYDPLKIIVKIKNSLALSRKPVIPETLQKMAKMIGKLVDAKSDIDYKESFDELLKLQLPQGVLNDIIGCRNKVFYLEMPKIFIGLNRYNVQTISHIICSKIQGETTILQLFRRITALDQEQKCQSGKLQIFDEPLEKVLGEKRLTAVRLCINRSLFRLFMENYISSLGMVARRMVNHDTGSIDFQVADMTTQIPLEVNDWECVCAEHLKTGVPCSHLIACAGITPEKSYLDLFKKRWRLSRIGHGAKLIKQTAIIE